MTGPEPRIEELFHAARALKDTRARRAYLERTCGGDAELRARVEELLAADADASASFLAAPHTTTSGEQPGQWIDRYKLLQAIGEGGMGTVWMAEQREPVVRKVALKIIKLGMDTREVVVRFEAERQALALMEHPHIAKVLDGGATATGRPYFVMELVKGVPITEYCDQARLGLRERLELFSRVCEAIQHAHHKGVIHRDIKPSNVLVTLHDGVPVPKVIDFGIAKATSAELTKKTLFTQYAQILGTPEYMAPEQAELSGLDIDTRADVYSLGVLLYELLTGTKPFDVKTALEAGFQELLRTIREDDPVKPSTRVSTLGDRASPTAANRQVNVEAWSQRLRGDLDWIVMKALEKDRSRRYDTPNGFAEDIARYLRDEAVVAAPPSAAYRFKKLVRRRRKTVIAAATIGLLLVAGIAGTSTGLVWALSERDRADVAAAAEKAANIAAQANAQRAADEAARAEGEAARARGAEKQARERADELEAVSRFQASQLGRIDPALMGVRLRQDLLDEAPAAQRETLTTGLAGINFTNIALHALEANVFRRSITAIDADFASQPLVQAQLLQAAASTLDGLGSYTLANDAQDRALALRTKLLGRDAPATLESLFAAANVRKDGGRLAEAESLAREACERSQRVFGTDDLRTYEALQVLGATLWHVGKLEEAENTLRDAILGLQRVGGEDHAAAINAQNSLGVVLHLRGKYAECEQLQREVVLRQRRVAGPEAPVTLAAIQNLAATLGVLHDAGESEMYTREALAGLRKAYGDDDPRTLNSLHALGTTLQRQGRFVEAEPVCREALAARLRVLGETHMETLESLYNLGTVLLDQNEFAESETVLRRALAAQRRTLGDEHPDTLNSLDSLAAVLRETGRLDEALTLSREALAAQRRVHGDAHIETWDALNNLGALLWSLGKPAEAVPYLRECFERRKAFHGPEDLDTLLAEANLGVNLHDAGELENARAALEDAWNGAQHHPELRFVAGPLLDTYAQLGERERAAAFRNGLERAARATSPAGSLQLASTLSMLCTSAVATRDWTEADALVQECLEIRQRTQPDAWTTFNAVVLLGRVRLGQQRFREAEPLLLAGCAGLEQREATLPPEAKIRIREAFASVVELYTAWDAAEPGAGHAEQAAEWRARSEQRQTQTPR